MGGLKLPPGVKRSPPKRISRGRGAGGVVNEAAMEHLWRTVCRTPGPARSGRQIRTCTTMSQIILYAEFPPKLRDDALAPGVVRTPGEIRNQLF